MARAIITEAQYSAELAPNVDAVTVQNLGPGFAMIVVSASAPGDTPGQSGFRLPSGAVLPLFNLGGAVGLYVGAEGAEVEIEWLSA